MHIRRPLIALACAVLPAALLPKAVSAGVTLDPSQIAKIDALFKDYDRPGSPGCSLGVLSDGRIIYTRGYGQATLDPPRAIESTTQFDIASMSKQFTAASIVLLAQQGRISLTDDVRKYIPELPNYGTPITINNLLWHTSGLRDYTVLLLLGSFDYPEVTTEQQAFDFVKRQRKLDFTPGTRYSYSNTGYFLMSLIVKRVSGLSLNDFARRSFFNPLSMPNSIFRDRHDLPIPNGALGYSGPDPDDGSFSIFMSNWEQVGDGGLQTSIEELQKWDENFYSGQVGGPEFVQEMLHTGQLSNGRKLTYARGLQVDKYRGLDRVQHGGDWVGYHSNFVRFPTEHTSVALMCNLEEAPQYELSQGVIDIVMEKAFTEPKPVEPTPQPPLPADRFVGEYYSKDKKEVYSITKGDNGLVFNLLYITIGLTPLGPTTFMLDGFPTTRVEFTVNGNAPASALQFRIDKDDTDTLPDRASRFTAPAPGDISPYLGKFYSPELNVTWSIVIDDEGQFAVNDNDKTPALPITGPLHPVSRDSFYGQAGFLQFTRNASGVVDGFNMSYNGTLDYRFTLKGR